MTRLGWLGVVAGASVLAGVTVWGFHATPEVHVDSAVVSTGPTTRHVSATGTVQPVTLVEVGALVTRATPGTRAQM